MSFRLIRLTLMVLVASLFTVGVNAQERGLGTWKTHMPYGSSLGAFDAGDRVYSIAQKTVFSYDKNTGAIQIYDKVNGLSDVGIKLANYDPQTKVLVIAYTNSNLDFIYNGTEIYNIPDIKNKNQVSAVSINGISFYAGNAYVSSDIGVSVINLDRKEISNTYIIGNTGSQVKVYGTTVNNNIIYAATQEGVKRASLNSANLQDYNNWTLFDTSAHLPLKKASFIVAFNDKVYAAIGNSTTDTLYEYNGSVWNNLYSMAGQVVSALQVQNDNLYISTIGNNYSSHGSILKLNVSGNVITPSFQYAYAPKGWFESNGVAWIANEWGGLIKSSNGASETIIPDGPGSTNIYDLVIEDNVLYVAPGGADDIWEPIFNRDGFFMYKDGKWDNRNPGTDAALANLPGINGIAPAPAAGNVYLASFLYGIGEYNLSNRNCTIYNKDNSILELTQNTTIDTRMPCATTDRYGNVWFGNAGATKPIKLLKADHTWKDFAVPYSIAVIKKIVIDQNDQLWMPLRYTGGGLLVYSYNQTIDDASDDHYRLVKSGSGLGGLPNENIFSMAEDKEGNMWVGTDQGIAVFYCPGSILTTNGCDADQIKVERDGYIGYLFGTESIRALAVDAANRKWVGTTNGLWLISDDGKKELLKFTTDNSPLPTNQITDIAINDESGEVFIGTTGGLVSYQGDAMGECSDCDGALVYPNPVKPEYNGPIAIKGLTENAYVKITDVSGTLIFQGKANGSQMIWDGKGYNGARAKSGVYLVFSSTDLGKERKVAKILLTN